MLIGKLDVKTRKQTNMAHPSHDNHYLWYFRAEILYSSYVKSVVKYIRLKSCVRSSCKYKQSINRQIQNCATETQSLLFFLLLSTDTDIMSAWRWILYLNEFPCKRPSCCITIFETTCLATACLMYQAPTYTKLEPLLKRRMCSNILKFYYVFWNPTRHLGEKWGAHRCATLIHQPQSCDELDRLYGTRCTCSMETSLSTIWPEFS